MATRRIKVLLIDDDEDEFILTRSLLTDRSFQTKEVDQIGFHLEWIDNFDAALTAMRRQEHDVFLVDYRLGERNGLDLLREAEVRDSRVPVILMTGQGSYQVDVNAMNFGATDYLVKSELTAPLLERTIRYAIERKRAEEDIRQNALRAELLAELSHEFAQVGLNYPEILDTITRRVAEATQDAVIIRLLSEDGLWLDEVAYHHSNPEVRKILEERLTTTRLRINEDLAGEAFESRKPLLINREKEPERIEKSLLYTSLPGALNAESVLIVPLGVHGQIIGTLGLVRFEANHPFSQEDKIFFQDLGDRAALAIENARLYFAEASRARELNALQTATAALLTTIDLEALLGRILDIAQGAIPQAEQGLLYLIAPETGKLQIRAITTTNDPRIRKIRFPRDKDYPARAVRERKPLLLSDIQADQERNGKPYDRISMRSAVLAPLVLKDEILGVIYLGCSRPAAFTESDLRLLVSFATTTTAAIQNAVLHAEVQKLAVTDGLTEFYNRRGFFELGQREVERAVRFGRPLSAIMVDLDRFKDINDTYGHAAGDQVLRILSERLRSSVRELDILGRYGGDEFAILLPETDIFTACIIAERIRSRVSETLSVNIPPVTAGDPNNLISMQITASLGVSHTLAGNPDLSKLLERADAAAYIAKNSGRDRVEVG